MRQSSFHVHLQRLDLVVAHLKAELLNTRLDGVPALLYVSKICYLSSHISLLQ